MYINDIKLFARNEKELETLTQTKWKCIQDIQMKFGIEKYAMFLLKIGKRETTEGTELQNQESIRMLEEKENCYYMGILEADTIRQTEMKGKKKRKKKVVS